MNLFISSLIYGALLLQKEMESQEKTLSVANLSVTTPTETEALFLFRDFLGD